MFKLSQVTTKGKVNLEKLPRIDADSIQMRQLLQNLIENALKYDKNDTPSQALMDSSFKIKKDWSVNIKDNLIGLNEKILPTTFSLRLKGCMGRLFTKIQELAWGHLQKKYICHGGYIFMKSQKAQGSTFTFSETQSPTH